MGKSQSCCCCSSSTTESPEAHQMKQFANSESCNSEPTSASTKSCNSEPSSPSQRGRKSQGRRIRSASTRSFDTDSVVNEGCTCHLKCLIIPSFGKNPPQNVVKKKASSDFLKGVGDYLKKNTRLHREGQGQRIS